MSPKGIFANSPDWTIWLLSASPRRKDLLASLGVQFQLFLPQVQERQPLPMEKPADYVLAMARLKQAAMDKPRTSSKNVYISADTIVCINNVVLGKPVDALMAMSMLRQLNNRGHRVLTAVAITGDGIKDASFVAESSVYFGNWPDAVLQAYVKSGESYDKAGAYAIQGLGACLIDHIEGSWTNVVGLPLEKLALTLLEKNVILPV